VEDDRNQPPDLVPGDSAQPSNQPIDEEVVSVPLDTGEGDEVVVAQENTGWPNIEGSGEWPETGAPPRGPAPGSDDDLRRELEERRKSGPDQRSG
jgi:hypothetical protein